MIQVPPRLPSQGENYSLLWPLPLPLLSPILAAAIVTSDRQILSEFITRQDEVHGPVGGIIPKTAAEYHARNIDQTVEEAMRIAKA